MTAGGSRSRAQESATPHRGPQLQRGPQLGVVWESPAKAFWDSFRALLYGPAPPRGWPQAPFFRDGWVRTNLPARALLASALWHIIVFNINVPFWSWFASRNQPKREYPRIEVTWYAPTRDLRPLVAPSLPRKKARPPSPLGEEKKPAPPKGADAYHPRQIILSAPARPTHPRQTLIQPDSPPEAPKILPALPNIVQWNQTAQPPRPKLTLKQARLRRREARRPLPEIAAPVVPAEQRLEGDLNIAPSAVSIPRPKLAITPTAVAKAGARNVSGEVEAAPELGPSPNGNDANVKNIIALSATPAPPSPAMQVPAGNLSARILISPEGSQAGVPGGSPSGTPGGTGGTGGSAGSPGGTGSGTQPGVATGPAGISITGGDPSKASTTAGPGGTGGLDLRPDRRVPPNAQPGRPAARVAPLSPEPNRTKPSPAFEAMKPGAPPEVILGPKRIYTLNVNAPNLASATGSWVLQFAELAEEGNKTNGTQMAMRTDPLTDLVGPVPVRKVDPKYPPVLITARVQGDVILYAIIRKDGSVDSIQVVKGLDPRLDQNAMEALARWKFRPAERRGEPVELEAVVTIPFRAVAPF
ncbi:MAG: TonB family protein [Acidobacteria bacterium]|nr:TonB family protein [Acidobacteriota bacterium]MBI3664452.1 TonB family protein [Acidobacteriota bacterium]